jgi:DNA-binding SARP family transcriptional activator
MSSTEQLRIHLLGGFRVLVDGHVVGDCGWRHRKAVALIKLLALEPGHRLHREALMDVLWPELDLEAQANNLAVVLYHARRKLDAAGAQQRSFLTREGDMVALALADAVWVDVDAFEYAVTRAWRSDDLSLYYRAVDLYTGDLLPEDPFDEWLDGSRLRLRNSYQALLARLAQLEEVQGERDACMLTLQRLIGIDPTHEEAHAALMRLYARTGQRSQAIAQYALLERALARDLDVAPGEHVRELCDAIRAGNLPPDAQRQPDASKHRAVDPSPATELEHEVEHAVARLLSVRTRSDQAAWCSNRHVERRGRYAGRNGRRPPAA